MRGKLKAEIVSYGYMGKIRKAVIEKPGMRVISQHLA